MKMVKMLRDGTYGRKGKTIQVTDELAERLIADKAAVSAEPAESTKKAGKGIRNKSLSASA